mmetsp:Transcript_22910/g.46604  ORF Transcript_22910/g.46604 Transcript_22910/m.46604 type:complete len:173 (+) Transcript_22910:1094-1612(+)
MSVFVPLTFALIFNLVSLHLSHLPQLARQKAQNLILPHLFFLTTHAQLRFLLPTLTFSGESRHAGDAASVGLAVGLSVTMEIVLGLAVGIADEVAVGVTVGVDVGNTSGLDVVGMLVVELAVGVAVGVAVGGASGLEVVGLLVVGLAVGVALGLEVVGLLVGLFVANDPQTE